MTRSGRCRAPRTWSGRCRTDGTRIALASSGDPEFAREAVDLLGIGDLVEVLTTSEDADASKPEPDLVGVTLDRMDGVERAVFVGDTPYDVEAANRAGLGCLALLTGGFGSAELTDAGALRVAESPADLVGIRVRTTSHVSDRSTTCQAAPSGSRTGQPAGREGVEPALASATSPSVGGSGSALRTMSCEVLDGRVGDGVVLVVGRARPDPAQRDARPARRRWPKSVSSPP